MTKWRIQEHLALSTLREMWVPLKDGTLARAKRVLVQKRGKRFSIQTQVVKEAGFLQPRQTLQEWCWLERVHYKGAAACL